MEIMLVAEMPKDASTSPMFSAQRHFLGDLHDLRYQASVGHG